MFGSNRKIRYNKCGIKFMENFDPLIRLLDGEEYTVDFFKIKFPCEYGREEIKVTNEKEFKDTWWFLFVNKFDMKRIDIDSTIRFITRKNSWMDTYFLITNDGEKLLVSLETNRKRKKWSFRFRDSTKEIR